jgi:hypothetical protein
MKLGVLFGMIMIAVLDVTRTQCKRAYGCTANDSLEYVLLVAMGLLVVFYAFPNMDC